MDTVFPPFCGQCSLILHTPLCKGMSLRVLCSFKASWKRAVELLAGKGCWHTYVCVCVSACVPNQLDSQQGKHWKALPHTHTHTHAHSLKWLHSPHNSTTFHKLKSRCNLSHQIRIFLQLLTIKLSGRSCNCFAMKSYGKVAEWDRRAHGIDDKLFPEQQHWRWQQLKQWFTAVA